MERHAATPARFRLACAMAAGSFVLVALGACSGDEAGGTPGPTPIMPGPSVDSAGPPATPSSTPGAGTGHDATAALPRPDGGRADSGQKPSTPISTYPPACSGAATCTGKSTDAAVHFHHVHLNATDPAKSIAFYTSYYKSEGVFFNGLVDAVRTQRSFLLFERAAGPLDADFETGVEHIGWGAVDVRAWFADAEARGLAVDTPPTSLGLTFYTYARGPDRERVEVYTGQNDDFNHVHLLCADVDATTPWWEKVLGVKAQRTAAYVGPRFSANSIVLDNVTFNLFGPPYTVPSAFQPTDDRPIAHVAVSVTDLEAAAERLRGGGVEIAEPIAARAAYGFRSFFVRSPDRVLVEFVEADPVP